MLGVVASTIASTVFCGYLRHPWDHITKFSWKCAAARLQADRSHRMIRIASQSAWVRLCASDHLYDLVSIMNPPEFRVLARFPTILNMYSGLITQGYDLSDPQIPLRFLPWYFRYLFNLVPAFTTTIGISVCPPSLRLGRLKTCGNLRKIESVLRVTSMWHFPRAALWRWRAPSRTLLYSSTRMKTAIAAR